MQGFNYETTQEEMVKFAMRFGVVQTFVFPMDHKTQKHKNYFFVKYENRRDAYKALQQSGKHEVRN